MIFKADHVTLIQAGQKTQTRRLGKCRWVVGHVHPVKVGWYSKPECWVRIQNVTSDRLGNMTPEDAAAEGYSAGLDGYKAAWERIWKQPWDPDTLVWVVDFRLVAKERMKQTSLLDQLEE